MEHPIVQAATALFNFVQANPLSNHAERQAKLYQLMEQHGLSGEDERDAVLWGAMEMQLEYEAAQSVN